MTARKPRVLPIVAAFAVMTLVEVAFVLAVADDAFTRAVVIAPLVIAQLGGAIVFTQLTSGRIRRPQRDPRQGRRHAR